MNASPSLRRVGDLDPAFEALMAKLVRDEPRRGYSAIEHVPPLGDEELAAVVGYVAEVRPEDFRELLNADALEDFAQALRVRLFTPMVRNAAMGEILRGRLDAAARLWLVTYAAEECEVLRDLEPDFDHPERERLGGAL